MKRIFGLALMSIPFFFACGPRVPEPAAELGAPPGAVTVPYERYSRGWAIGDFARILRGMATGIRQANRLLLEEHEIRVRSPIELKQSYREWFRPGGPRYNFAIDVKLGEGLLPRSEEQHGLLLQRHNVIAKDERSGMAPEHLADYLDGLAKDLSDGILSFEGNQLEIGQTLDFSIVHTVSGEAVNGVAIAFPFGEEIPREKPPEARKHSYSRESEYLSMAEVGRILERLGREIHEKGSATIGGGSFDVSGEGGFNIYLSQGGPRGGTSIGVELVSRKSAPEGWRKFFVPYERRGSGWTRATFATLVAAVGETLARTGIFVLEDDSATFSGTASVQRRLVERFRPGRRQHTFYLDIGFGPQELPIPEEEYLEELRPQEELVKEKAKDVDQATLAGLLGTLSRDLESGWVRVGGEELVVGEDLDFRFKHTSSIDGRSHRIQVTFAFGEEVSGAEPRRPASRSFSRESRDTPMRDIAALLQGIGTEILSDGTFHLGGAEFQTGEAATIEIKAIEGRVLEIEVGYRTSSQEQ